MKKGDEYIGKESGLRLKVRDKTANSILIEVERRVIDRRTAKIRVDTREREVPNDLVNYLLLGYQQA